jgi:hypothetical protein
MDSIPLCAGSDELRAVIRAESTRFVPKEVARLPA